MRTALVVGATGLIGSNCVRLLLGSNDYGKVVVLVRKRISSNDPKLDQHIINFDELDKYSNLIKADDLFYCLGSTIKKAGSKEVFNRFDFEYACKIAKIASANGVSKFLLVSSLGANENSGNFYLSVKGRLEEEIKKNNFSAIHIFRPSILIGERAEKRIAEKIALAFLRIFSFIFVGFIINYRPIEGEKVAKSMIKSALSDGKGVFIHESRFIG